MLKFNTMNDQYYKLFACIFEVYIARQNHNTRYSTLIVSRNVILWKNNDLMVL